MTEIDEKLIRLADISINECDNFDDSLMDGKAGVVLFLFYFARYTRNKHYENQAEIILNSLFEKGISSNPSYCSGSAGIVWLILHLSKNNYIKYDYKTGLKEIISYLMDYSDICIKHGNYDFLHGLGGILHALTEGGCYYHLEIEKLSIHILEMGEMLEDNGFVWKSYELEDLKKSEVITLGLAHGLSSNISILTNAYAITNDTRLKQAIQRTIWFLKNSVNSEVVGSIFPDVTSLSRKINRFSRLAWCHGDLGIALGLLKTTNIADNTKLVDLIIDNSIPRKNLNANLVYDASICHGSSGIAHIYNRLNGLGLSQCTNVSRYWLNQTLSLDYHKDGFSGYKSLQGLGEWHNEIGLLNGISGIGLSLLGFVSEDISVMNWDRSLLIT